MSGAPIRLWATALGLSLLLLAAPAAAQTIDLPVTVSRGQVTVRAEAGMDELARRTADRAAPALARIAEDLEGLPTPKRIEIRLVKSNQDIGRASPPGYRPPEWAAGVAYPRQGVVVVAHRRGPNLIDVDSVTAHELAHLALGAALGGRAPRWLDEGFAYLHSSDFSLARARTLTGMAWSGNVIPLHDLDRSFPAREDAAARAYAQSYDFVVFLARRGAHADSHDDGDRFPFRAFLARVASGMTLDEAALASYSSTMNQLFAEWYQDLRTRYLTLPASLVGLGVWVLGAILLIIAYLRRRVQNRRKLALWEEEERYAGSPTDSTNRKSLPGQKR